jgi:hypothetical protein
MPAPTPHYTRRLSRPRRFCIDVGTWRADWAQHRGPCGRPREHNAWVVPSVASPPQRRIRPACFRTFVDGTAAKPGVGRHRPARSTVFGLMRVATISEILACRRTRIDAGPVLGWVSTCELPPALTGLGAIRPRRSRVSIRQTGCAGNTLKRGCFARRPRRARYGGRPSGTSGNRRPSATNECIRRRSGEDAEFGKATTASSRQKNGDPPHTRRIPGLWPASTDRRRFYAVEWFRPRLSVTSLGRFGYEREQRTGCSMPAGTPSPVSTRIGNGHLRFDRLWAACFRRRARHDRGPPMTFGLSRGAAPHAAGQGGRGLVETPEARKILNTERVPSAASRHSISSARCLRARSARSPSAANSDARAQSALQTTQRRKINRRHGSVI